MRAHKSKNLLVYIAGVRAGILSQDEHGLRSFAYDGAYDGPPLSLAMPLANKTYRDRARPAGRLLPGAFLYSRHEVRGGWRAEHARCP